MKLFNFISSFFTLTFIFILVAGCSQTEEAAPTDVVESDKQRVMAPAATAEEITTLSEGNGEFAVAMYQTLKEEEGNLFFSPFSISKLIPSRVLLFFKG